MLSKEAPRSAARGPCLGVGMDTARLPRYTSKRWRRHTAKSLSSIRTDEFPQPNNKYPFGTSSDVSDAALSGAVRSVNGQLPRRVENHTFPRRTCDHSRSHASRAARWPVTVDTKCPTAGGPDCGP